MNPKDTAEKFNSVWGIQALEKRRELNQRHYDENATNRNVYIKKNAYFYGFLFFMVCYYYSFGLLSLNPR